MGLEGSWGDMLLVVYASSNEIAGTLSFGYLEGG